jgi:phospholipid/cholesterol/gamma-HCH transport system permease protein
MRRREPEIFRPPRNDVARLGREFLLVCRSVGRAGLLLWDAILSMRHVLSARVRREVVTQMMVYGIKSLGVITIVAVFIGMILALQTGIELRKFNQEVYIGTAVMATMLREMGPFMTGLILAACVASAIAAHLGTMVVSEEIDALDVMSIDPVRFLVMPRIVAMGIMTPLLSFYTCVMGVIGGGVVGMTQLGVSWDTYIEYATRYAELRDLYVGMVKAFVFGILLTTVACHEGLSTTQGAVGVGLATRKTVIECFLLILVIGYFITRLFY